MIPTLQKYYGQNYFILTVDDDWIYKNEYIETMLNEIKEYDVYCPHNCVIGNRMIYKSYIFEECFWNNLTSDIIETGVDDSYILSYLKYKKVKMKLQFNQRIKEMIKPYNEVSPLHDYYKQNNRINLSNILSNKIWKI